MDRRKFLQLGVGLLSTSLVAEVEVTRVTPVIDTHIHLFDPTRKGGVPWPKEDDSVIYKPALPGQYEKASRPLGVVGAIVVEASPLESDNDWVLEQANNHPMIVGLVGDLVPGSSSYGKQLDRLRTNPLFLGIRYGNLWDRDLSVDMRKPGFLSDIQKLAASGLELDSANPDPSLIRAILDLSQKVPELRFIIDHLPASSIPDERGVREEYWSNLEAISQNSHVFVKFSEVPVQQGNTVPKDISFYKDKLDRMWDLFGEERILFGSDWPNSEHFGSYSEIMGLMRSYMSTKSPLAVEKFFWRNSIAAYRWHPREASQKLA